LLYKIKSNSEGKMLDWERFAIKETDKILNYVFKIVNNVENSQDIVQDTFLAFYENADKIEESYQTAWLYRTAHNKAINFLKKHSRMLYGETPDQPHHDGIDEYIINKRKQELIQKCFSELKPKYAMILELQYYQQKSYKDIAVITGMSVAAIVSILVRAKKQCKNIMKDYQDIYNIF
jgi:RNA polymerase sigma-70 factor (ECF subfamily)